MGLFDYIQVQCPLPHAASSDEEFQTKTFDCAMEHYRITPEGRLEFQEYTIEDRSDKNAPAGSFESIFGCMTQVPTGVWRDLNWHGYITFIGKFGEYRAKFTDGRLVKIETLNFDSAETPVQRET